MICDHCRTRGECYGYTHCETRELRARVAALELTMHAAWRDVAEEKKRRIEAEKTAKELRQKLKTLNGIAAGKTAGGKAGGD